MFLKRFEPLEHSLQLARQLLLKDALAIHIDDRAKHKADELQQGTIAILKLLFNAGRGVSGQQIAQRFNMHPSVVDHHIDKLFEKRFITQATVGDSGANCSYRIEPKGQDYIIKSGLFDPNQRPPQRPPNDPHRLGMM
jgi:DNA-binding MarR family transcriptional regulator